MKPGETSDIVALELIVELANLAREQVCDSSFEKFATNRTEVDAATYRLMSIGEASRSLSAELKARHPSQRWAAMYAMRNVLAHSYRTVVPERIWQVIHDDLNDLLAICREELERFKE